MQYLRQPWPLIVVSYQLSLCVIYFLFQFYTKGPHQKVFACCLCLPYHFSWAGFQQNVDSALWKAELWENVPSPSGKTRWLHYHHQIQGAQKSSHGKEVFGWLFSGLLKIGSHLCNCLSPLFLKPRKQSWDTNGLWLNTSYQVTSLTSVTTTYFCCPF